jgi:hypothetical protein
MGKKKIKTPYTPTASANSSTLQNIFDGAFVSTHGEEYKTPSEDQEDHGSFDWVGNG